MENLIIYLVIAVVVACITTPLCLTLAYKNGKLKSLFENKDSEFNRLNENYNQLSKENKSLKFEQQVYAEKTIELNKENEKLKNEIEKLQKEIDILSDVNKNIVAENKKLSDEITILKEQVGSLNNLLEEKSKEQKPFAPLKELDNLTIRKEENKSPEAKPKKKQSPKQ